jgi:hypothetical protein
MATPNDTIGSKKSPNTSSGSNTPVIGPIKKPVTNRYRIAGK